MHDLDYLSQLAGDVNPAFGSMQGQLYPHRHCLAARALRSMMVVFIPPTTVA
jgi:hypothetical protein